MKHKICFLPLFWPRLFGLLPKAFLQPFCCNTMISTGSEKKRRTKAINGTADFCKQSIKAERQRRRLFFVITISFDIQYTYVYLFL
jgi:hypothetical protein